MNTIKHKNDFPKINLKNFKNFKPKKLPESFWIEFEMSLYLGGYDAPLAAPEESR